MKRSALPICAILFGAIVPATQASAQGVVTVPLENVPRSCINVEKSLVDFWILSARVPKKENWLSKTEGVGIKVDTVLSSSSSRSQFPAAKAISTENQKGKIIRAPLGLHPIDQYDFHTNDAKTTSLEFPISFLRRNGSSTTAKLTRALIDFTNSSQSSLPPNPYSQGAELVGNLANSMMSAFQPDPDKIVDPNFQLEFGLGRVDSNCHDNQLQTGMGAKITGYSGSDMTDIIPINQLSSYCFYRTGDKSDPDIGYVAKTSTSATCASTAPAGLKIVRNPQIIYAAYAICKTATGCGAQTVTTTELQGLQAVTAEVDAAETLPLGAADAQILRNAIRSGDLAAVRSSDRIETVAKSLAICSEAGITPEQCFGARFDGSVATPK